LRILAFLALAGFVSTVFLQLQIPQKRLSDSIVFEFNENFASFSPDTLKVSTFGYARAASSLLWIRFLLHTPVTKVEKNQFSWIFLDLLTIANLDPDFYPVYEHGGIFLSVITEDKLGAEKILLRGIERFPDRWRLRAYLAYHYQFEMGEIEKAGEQYIEGAKIPGAPFLLGARAISFLEKRENQEKGVDLLWDLYRSASDPVVKRRFADKLRIMGEVVNE
jgi:hypothetical protein